MLRVQGRPAVSYDDQGLVFAIAYGGYIRMFDARNFEKVMGMSMLFDLNYPTHLTSYIHRGLLIFSLSVMMIQKPMS